MLIVVPTNIYINFPVSYSDIYTLFASFIESGANFTRLSTF